MSTPFLYPTILEEFYCIADKCPLTCCGGWNIYIDDDKLEKYSTISDVSENILENSNRFKLRESGCCSMLDSNGLCNIVLKYGEDFLCGTCKLFPRDYKVRYGVEEMGLVNGCPKVLSILNNTPTPLSFTLSTDKFPGEYSSAPDIRLRNAFLDTIQYSKIPFWTRLYAIYELSKELKDCELENTESVVIRYDNHSTLVAQANTVAAMPFDFERIVYLLNSIISFLNPTNWSFEIFPYITRLKDKSYSFSIESLEEKRRLYTTNYHRMIENMSVNTIYRSFCSKEPAVFLPKTLLLLSLPVLAIYIIISNDLIYNDTSEDDIYAIFTFLSRFFENTGQNTQNELIKLYDSVGLNEDDISMFCKFLG